MSMISVVWCMYMPPSGSILSGPVLLWHVFRVRISRYRPRRRAVRAPKALPLPCAPSRSSCPRFPLSCRGADIIQLAYASGGGQSATSQQSRRRAACKDEDPQRRGHRGSRDGRKSARRTERARTKRAKFTVYKGDGRRLGCEY